MVGSLEPTSSAKALTLNSLRPLLENINFAIGFHRTSLTLQCFPSFSFLLFFCLCIKSLQFPLFFLHLLGLGLKSQSTFLGTVTGHWSSFSSFSSSARLGSWPGTPLQSWSCAAALFPEWVCCNAVCVVVC